MAPSEQLTTWLRAMAHPTRLRILQTLARDGECCVCHLTAVLGKRQPYVSQSLRLLRDSGLVADRRDGYMIYYRLADPRIASVLLSLTQVSLDLSGDDAAAIPAPPVPGCPCPSCKALIGSS